MNPKRRVLFIVITFMVIVATLNTHATEQGESHSEQLSFTRPLVISNSAKWKPYSYINEQGEPAGILIDYWQAVAQKNQFEIEFKLVDWAESIELVKNGEADFHAGLIQSSERDVYFDFGPKIIEINTQFFLSQRLIGTDLNKVFSGDIEFKIGVVLGGNEVNYAKKHFPKLKFIYFANNHDLLKAAVDDVLDGFIADYQVANFFMFTGNYRINYVPVRFLYSKSLRLGVKQDNKELLSILEKSMSKLSDSSRIKLLSNWIYRETVYPKYFLPVVIGVALTILFIYILMLRRAVRYKTIDLKNANQLLEKLTQTDELTNISNRRHFHSKIKMLQGTSMSFTLLVFDIDNFKQINDQFGHDVGDQAIVHVVRSIENILSKNDFMARLGGEEFAIILTKHNFEEAQRKAELICQRVYERPLLIMDQRLILSISLGGVHYDTVPDQVMLNDADHLMYEAKALGKNRAIVSTIESIKSSY